MENSQKFETIDQYLLSLPKEVQTIVQKVRSIIKKAVPTAVEAIGYGMPAFKYKGKALVYFAGWKNHIGFYATPSGNEAFKKELSKYKGAKGSVRFPLDEQIPYDLIEKIALYRAEEISAKQ